MAETQAPIRTPLFRRGRGRDRGQNGHLEIIGKRVQRWKGHYYVYEQQPDGTEVRRHKSITLGLRSEMTRKQANDKLRLEIATQAETARPAKADLTFGQFWKERFLPMKESRWKASSRSTQIDNITRYCVAFLEDIPLREIERFKLQMIANRLASKYSSSVVGKYVTWTKAILEEAVEQEFIARNPARRLELPETREENKRFLTLNEISVVLARLPLREQLILRMSMVLGLRPSVLFALRWNDIEGHALRLDESTVDGLVYPTMKTKKSKAYVALPSSLRRGLLAWRNKVRVTREDQFIFPNVNGGVIRVDNYRADVLRPTLDRIAKETGIVGIDFRACRRTCATHLSRHGGIKEVQAHLRHARATTTLDVYVQEIPTAVRAAVESLDASLGSKSVKQPGNRKKRHN
jgi:integrase